MYACCISSRINVIGGFSAPPNGFRTGHPSEMEPLPKAGDAKAHPEWDSFQYRR